MPVPRQLPADVRGFVNRSADLERLDAFLGDDGRPGGATVCVIAGTAGVGKTSLAVHWAHRRAERFPDGQLYINLRGYDPGEPVGPGHALERFLEALGLAPGAIPADPRARAALYRGLLADRRLLVVLDNAATAGQVRPLLPGADGCLVLVTSRNRLSGLVTRDGAERLSLDVLDEAGAVELVDATTAGHRAGDDHGHVAELARLCARLPLALRIAAERAAALPGTSLGTLIADLRDESSLWHALSSGEDAAGDGDAEAVRTVFAWSYRALPEPAARLFRLLGLHPTADFSTRAGAALAALPVAEARRLLDALADAHLLEELGPDRWQFHDLLRAYATDLAHAHDSDAERREAQSRVLDHYTHTAALATRLLHPLQTALPLEPPLPGAAPEDLADQAAALAWYQTEFPVLRAAIARAADRGFDDHAWRLPWLLHTFMYQQAHSHVELAEIHRVALAAAERSGDPLGRGCASHALGTALILLGRHNEGLDLVRQATILYDSVGGIAFLANAYHDIAYAYEVQNRPADALVYAQRSLELYRQTDARAGLAAALNAVGWYHALTHDHHGSLAYCRQAADLAHEIGDRFGEAAALDSIGYAHHNLGDHAEAIAHYRQAVDLAVTISDRFMEAGILAHLGDAYRETGDGAAARAAWRRALEIHSDIAHPDADELRAKLREPDPAERDRPKP